MPNSNLKLIDTFPLACFCIDKDFNILHVNSLGLKILNNPLTETKNKSISVYFPEINLCLKHEGENIKTVFVDKKGKKSDVILKYASLDEGSLFGIVYVIQDSHSNQHIIEKQKFNDIILDNIPADIAFFDINHNYLYVNPNGVRDVETRKWLIGKSDFDYCDYKGLDKTLAQGRRDLFNQAIQTKQQVEWVDEYHRDGKDIYIMRRFYPVFIDDIFYYVIGYGMDVSDLKRIQNTVISNEKRNKLILKSSYDAIIKFESDGKITFWNPKADQFFGWKSDEVIGKIIFDIIFPKTIGNAYSDRIIEFINGDESFVLDQIIETSGIKRNKQEFPIEISILPLKDPNDRVSFCTFIRDITSRKEKEEEVALQNKILQSQNSELEQFTYITSHDLQEPLLTLISFSELLLEEYTEGLNDEAKLYIEFINKSAIRMRALVSGLMEYARIGKRDNVKEIDCNQVLNDVLTDLSVIISKTKAEIEVENLPIIRGYETYIRLLFQNLISNAIKFNKENTKPEIKIKCSETINEWKFSVKDNGIGIEEKYIDQVFIIFKRLNNDTLYKGYGIGLAHCKKIVDIHNGEIYVKSTINKGSTFSFTISKNL
jgi:PAS domain S-box-containing protein